MPRSRMDSLQRLPRFGEYYRGETRQPSRCQQRQQPDFPSDSDTAGGDHFGFITELLQSQPQMPPKQMMRHRQQQPPQLHHQQMYSSRRTDNGYRLRVPPTMEPLATDAFELSGEEAGADDEDDGFISLQDPVRWQQAEKRSGKVFNSPPKMELLLQVNNYQCNHCGRRCTRVALPSPQRKPRHSMRLPMSALSPMASMSQPPPSRRQYNQPGPPPLDTSDLDGWHWKGGEGSGGERERCRPTRR